MTKRLNNLIALDWDSKEEYSFQNLGSQLLKHNDKEYKVELKELDSGITLLEIDGKTYPIEIVNKHQNEYEILVNGISYSFSVESPFSLTRLKALTEQKDQSSTIRIKSPMPGKILEVLVKTGDIVKAGDTLLILEAMKMQNAILASSKAIVKKVLVKDGETTSKSDLLIELEKEK